MKNGYHIPFWAWILIAIGILMGPDMVGIRHLGGPEVRAWYLPVWSYLRERFQQGQVPLWNPHIYSGLMMAGAPHAGIFYPPNWLLVLLPASAYISWTVALHLVLGGTGLALYLRRLDYDETAATFGGLAFMLSAPLLHLMDQPAALQVIAWWPWYLICLERGLVPWAGVVLGLQGLAGEPGQVMMSMVSGLILLLVRQGTTLGPTSTLVAWLSSSLIGLAVGAVQWLPYSDSLYLSLYRETAVPIAPSLSWPNLPALLLPEMKGLTALSARFVPTVVLLAAALSVSRKPRTAPGSALSFFVLLLSTLVLAAGVEGPLGGVLSYISQSETPVYSVLKDGLEGLIGHSPLQWLDWGLLALAGLAASGVEAALQWGGRKAASVLLALGFFNLVVLAQFAAPATRAGAIQAPAGWSVVDKDAPRHGGKIVITGEWDPAAFDWSCMGPYDNVTGYSPLVPRSYMEFLSYAVHQHLLERDDLIEALQNGHRMLSTGVDDRVLRAVNAERICYATRAGDVHSRPSEPNLPRLRVVRKFEANPDLDGLLKTLSRYDHKASAEVLLEVDADIDQREVDFSQRPLESFSSKVRLVSSAPESMTAEVEANQEALLVVADSFHSGWKATVNGLPKAVYRADGAARAIPIPPGKSTVVLTFRPEAYESGVTITMGALLLIALMQIRSMFFRRVHPPAPADDPTEVAMAMPMAAPVEPDRPPEPSPGSPGGPSPEST